MTLLNRYLAHYLEICQRGDVEKANGWRLAQEAAKNYPEFLSELPHRLTESMRRLNAEATAEQAAQKKERNC